MLQAYVHLRSLYGSTIISFQFIAYIKCVELLRRVFWYNRSFFFDNIYWQKFLAIGEISCLVLLQIMVFREP
jgi:hypothetical protein